MREFLRAEPHPFQHPFDDVAVVAKQPAGGVRVVAMVGSDLSAIERAKADCAFPILRDQELVDGGLSETGSSFPLGLKPLLPSLRIVALLFVKLFGASLCLFSLGVGASSFHSLLRSVSDASAFLNVFARCVFALLRALRIKLVKATLAVVSEVLGPFFRRAVCFSFLRAFHMRSVLREARVV